MKSSYAYFLAPFLGWLVAQGLKIILNRALFKKRRGFSKYLSSGDMPSAHSSTVMALTYIIFANEGFSPLFSVTVVFSAIILYDSLVSRRSIGEQGVALLRLIAKSPFAKEPLPKIALGHKPAEVIVGSAIGLVIGAIVAIFTTIS